MTTLAEYCAFLNEQGRSGVPAQEIVASGLGDRRALIAAHPEWRTLGLVDGLLAAAQLELDRDALSALELTELAIEISDDVRVPLPYQFLVTRTRGNAWKEHANALFRLTRLDDALHAVERALGILAMEPVLAVERANATLVLALVRRGQGDLDTAGRLVRESLEIFGTHVQPRGYLNAVQTEALISFDRGDVLTARDIYRAALELAERIDDERECARMLNNLGYCALLLHEFEAAANYLHRAFLGFTRNQMAGELLRAVRNAALLAKENGHLEEALSLLHGTYARFLDRGMVTEAAVVNLEIGDVVMELTGDSDYAQELCRTLEVTLGRYDVPRNVRSAINYLAMAAPQAGSTRRLREIIAEVVKFLWQAVASPSAEFSPAA
ncbi:MAG TPA: hypothetical protein VK504_08215 [Vicinamibacterales bacterium]|nr:hypothetical protein [Vicinamibacterales bacterium]